MLDDRTRLKHMLDAAETALNFMQGRQRQDLEEDQMLVFAVVRAIEIIGEAGSHLSKALQDAHPEIPWSAIIGMRHRLIHAYFEVNYEIIWKTVTQNLPVLIGQVTTLIEEIDKNNP
jgi:uncharacterized protein with HEPN domain